MGNGQLGELFIGSAKDALGFGAPNVIADESAFIEDPEFALVLRMLAGQKKIFLMKIGNPYFRNHLYKSFRDPDYKKIFVDYHRGLAEGRLNPEIVRKAKDEANFDILYECKFPAEDAVDSKRCAILVSEPELDRSYIEAEDYPFVGSGIRIRCCRRGEELLDDCLPDRERRKACLARENIGHDGCGL